MASHPPMKTQGISNTARVSPWDLLSQPHRWLGTGPLWGLTRGQPGGNNPSADELAHSRHGPRGLLTAFAVPSHPRTVETGTREALKQPQEPRSYLNRRGHESHRNASPSIRDSQPHPPLALPLSPSTDRVAGDCEAQRADPGAHVIGMATQRSHHKAHLSRIAPGSDPEAVSSPITRRTTSRIGASFLQSPNIKNIIFV